MSAPLRVRLFVEAPLAVGAPVALDEARSHYLRRVMRLGPGAAVAVFNGRDGEWEARVAPRGGGAPRLEAVARLRPQPPPAGPVLAFASIRPARAEMLAEKAAELGARLLQPVLTRRARPGSARAARLRAHAMEAAEQCGRLDAPEVAAPVALAELLAREEALAWGDPAGAAPAAALPGARVLLVGPEGGFDDAERRALAAGAARRAVSLGPRTLRTETAALALLVLWQALAGPDRML